MHVLTDCSNRPMGLSWINALFLDSTPVTNGVVYVSQTKIQTVQIVLPVHANHHGTTFGGQVRKHNINGRHYPIQFKLSQTSVLCSIMVGLSPHLISPPRLLVKKYPK